MCNKTTDYIWKLYRLFVKSKNVYRSQHRFKSYNHVVYTEEINKIALSANDDKRLQTFDGITTFPYGTNDFKVCESEMMVVRDLLVEKYVDCPFYCEIVWKKIKIRVLNV